MAMSAPPARGFDEVEFDGDGSHSITNAANTAPSTEYQTGSTSPETKRRYRQRRRHHRPPFGRYLLRCDVKSADINNTGTVFGLSNGVLDGGTDGAQTIPVRSEAASSELRSLRSSRSPPSLQWRRRSNSGSHVRRCVGLRNVWRGLPRQRGSLVGSIVIAADNPSHDRSRQFPSSIFGTVRLGGGNDPTAPVVPLERGLRRRRQ